MGRQVHPDPAGHRDPSAPRHWASRHQPSGHPATWVARTPGPPTLDPRRDLAAPGQRAPGQGAGTGRRCTGHGSARGARTSGRARLLHRRTRHRCTSHRYTNHRRTSHRRRTVHAAARPGADTPVTRTPGRRSRVPPTPGRPAQTVAPAPEHQTLGRRTHLLRIRALRSRGCRSRADRRDRRPGRAETTEGADLLGCRRTGSSVTPCPLVPQPSGQRGKHFPVAVRHAARNATLLASTADPTAVSQQHQKTA
jgi:hypothetical protein